MKRLWRALAPDYPSPQELREFFNSLNIALNRPQQQWCCACWCYAPVSAVFEGVQTAEAADWGL
jgi:hypothetical protein